MKQHTASAAVMEQVCVALNNIAANADNQVSIARAGGIESLVQVVITQTPIPTSSSYICTNAPTPQIKPTPPTSSPTAPHQHDTNNATYVYTRIYSDTNAFNVHADNVMDVLSDSC